MVILIKFIYMAAVICGVMSKGTASTVQIMMLLEYADAEWVIHIFNTF
jgi:hypothetical protein